MSADKIDQPARAGSSITVVGILPKLSATNLKRLAVYLVQGNHVLLQAPVTASGTFQFRLTASIVIDPCLITILGPKGLNDQTLLARTELPRLSLAKAAGDRAAEAAELKSVVTLDFTKFKLTDEIIEPWWIWCRKYTVSGTVQNANGCPVPGAEVTVYNVSSSVGGLVKTAIETVVSNHDGKFTATFNWCECLCCWPCWPIWWRCWPWWWELDILAVLENIERQLAQPLARGLRAPAAQMAPLNRPAGAALMAGQGFARESAVLRQDASRTAVIASKFANAQIRELFPWWWWCCDNPNIVFSVAQNGNIILDEDPSTSTRWCFASGQSVTLVGNSQSIAVCPPPVICEGFAWVSVANPGILVTDITNGYANGTPGSNASDMAFAGTLNIYGGFSDPNIPFYQVSAGLWTGNANPARGGVSPATSQPLSLPLSSTVVIFRAATSTFEFVNVLLGPCSFKGIDNLYMTTSQRMNPPAGVTGLGATPVLNPGDFVVTWADAGRILGAAASALIGGAAAGGVDLSADAYDASGNPVSLVTNNPLTLMIDTSSLSTAQITSLTAYTASGTQVFSTSSSTACPAYRIGPDGFVLLHVSVSDPNPDPSLSTNEHLFQYEIDTQFGHGSTSIPTAPTLRGYAQASSTFTPPSIPTQYYGVDSGYGDPDTAQVAYVGGGDTIQLSPQVSCCYDFQLWVGKRVTDGISFFCTWYNSDFQTATIDVSPLS
ncbi:MAG TPA: carboxypeptidase-like regulatory domain-containing protein [Bryobacteraceae bacterium]|nr:carboxypeptidase-like regulatory domain-containing protein [Bryobacteraceae bacterium]